MRPLGVGFYCRSFAKSPFFLSIHSTYGASICCYATRYVFATLKLDICSFHSHSICCLWQRVSIAPFLLAPQGISSALAPYRVADISSDASAAHIDVEPTCETHDGLDVPCHREQIKGVNRVCIISHFSEENDVSCESFGVAGDIYYPLWVKG